MWHFCSLSPPWIWRVKWSRSSIWRLFYSIFVKYSFLNEGLETDQVEGGSHGPFKIWNIKHNEISIVHLGDTSLSSYAMSVSPPHVCQFTGLCCLYLDQRLRQCLVSGWYCIGSPGSEAQGTEVYSRPLSGSILLWFFWKIPEVSDLLLRAEALRLIGGGSETCEQDGMFPPSSL